MAAVQERNEESVRESNDLFRPAHTLHTRAGEWRIPPGLRRALPFYFHKPWARIGHPIRLFQFMARQFGPVSHYSLFGTHIVFLNEPEYIREILINQASKFVRERTTRRLKILLGEGLLTTDDPTHKRSRRIMAPAFHRQNIAAYAGQMVEIASHTREQWQAGLQIDVAATMMQLSLEVVARTLFATDVDADVRAINDQTNIIMAIYNFLIAFPNLERFLSWPIPGVMRFRKARAQMDRVIERMIRERKQSGAHGTDLLSMLLEARDEDGSALSDEQLRDEVITIFLAGYETTANALSWTWYLLASNPDADARLAEELRTVLGTGDTARLPTLEDYPQLKYTQMVFAEAMRLYPPAWAMGRMSTEPIEIGPYRLPAGTHWFFSQYVLQRDPRFFPDPERFEPLRHTEEEKAKRPKFVYFPFGGGGRQCIGEGFAWMEGVLVIATLAQRWRMTLVPEQTVDVEEKITLRPRYPILVTLHPR